MSRICKLGVAVGKKGIGKTYQTTEMMKGYARGGKWRKATSSPYFGCKR